MQQHRFTSTTLFIWSGLLIWAANFLFVYVFAALACARGFSAMRVMGIGVITAATATSCVLATIATGVVMWSAHRRMRDQDSADEHSNFIRFVVIATGMLALVGTLYVLLPPLLFASHCDGGA